MSGRRRAATWARRLLIAGPVSLGVLAAFGFGFQSVATAQGASRYPPLGRRYDVGGYKLHLYCTGSGPTVVLFGGFPDWSIDWADTIQPALSRSTRACSFDPPGFGWSDPAPAAHQTPTAMAGTVHRLLLAAGEKGPYTLVAHSLGGIYARQFASLFPDQTAGMVLIDSSAESMLRRLPPDTTADQVQQIHALRSVRYLTPFGLQRLLRVRMASTDLRSPHLRSIAAALGYRTDSYFAAYDQLHRLLAESASGQIPTPRIPPIPLFVLTATSSVKTYGPVWSQLQDELAALSPSSHHLVVQSDHHIQRDHPAIVLNAIATVIAAES